MLYEGLPFFFFRFKLLTGYVLFRLNNDESSQEKSTLISKDVDGVEGDYRKLNKLGKCRSKISKVECSLDCGGDGDVDQPCQGTPSSREEKVSSLKTVSHLQFL